MPASAAVEDTVVAARMSASGLNAGSLSLDRRDGADGDAATSTGAGTDRDGLTLAAALDLDAAPGAILPEEARGAGHIRSPMLSIAIARRLAAAVANDAGAGHILAAGDAPLVSLFGPTPPEKSAPATARLEIVRAQDFGATDEMAAIPADAVSSALARLLG